MYTLDRPEADRLGAYAALDIETDGLDGVEDHLVAVGLGYVDGARAPEVVVQTLADARGDEVALIESALDWLDRRGPDGLVTYNGAGFDLPFLRARLAAHGLDADVDIAGRHVDLFTERQRRADLADERWPALEACLDAYGLPVSETRWEGAALTNARFGEELAPRYRRALKGLEFDRVRALERVICEYATADIEATIALYEADLGRVDVARDVLR